MSKIKKTLEPLDKIRKQAEIKLEKNLQTILHKPQIPTEKLLHELQVHQIELEMQNVELRRAQLELEALHQKYFDLFNLAPIGYFTIDKSGLITEVNLTGAELLGATKSDLLGKGFSHWIAKESQDTFYLHRREAIATGMQQTCELILIKSDGSEFFGQLTSRLESNENGNFMHLRITLMDITDRKKAEQKQLKYDATLKSMALKLTQTQERERKKLSTQIHDGINQRMAIIRLELQQIIQSISDSSLAATLNRISSEIHCIMQDSYSLMFELSNPILYELGLVAAITSLLESKLLKSQGIDCKIVTPDIHIELNQNSAIILYQAVHELLINISKHAKAKNVEVVIKKEKKHLRIEIKDDGIGFTPLIEKMPFLKGGFGLFHIRESILSIKGELNIESELQHGTTVTITVPLNL